MPVGEPVLRQTKTERDGEIVVNESSYIHERVRIHARLNASTHARTHTVYLGRGGDISEQTKSTTTKKLHDYLSNENDYLGK